MPMYDRMAEGLLRVEFLVLEMPIGFPDSSFWILDSENLRSWNRGNVLKLLVGPTELSVSAIAALLA